MKTCHDYSRWQSPGNLKAKMKNVIVNIISLKLFYVGGKVPFNPFTPNSATYRFYSV